MKSDLSVIHHELSEKYCYQSKLEFSKLIAREGLKKPQQQVGASLVCTDINMTNILVLLQNFGFYLGTVVRQNPNFIALMRGKLAAELSIVCRLNLPDYGRP